jgi:non-heme chloroperoxidase
VKIRRRQTEPFAVRTWRNPHHLVKDPAECARILIADAKSNLIDGGLPKAVFDGFQAQLAANRAQFYYDVPAGPFYGYNRPGAKPSQGVIWNWWRQGMMGGAKAHYDGIVAFSRTDFTEDLKKITVPVFVMHGDDDQIVPYADSAPLSAKLLKNGTLKTYKGFPHGMPTTEAETINADLLAFLKA